MSETTVVDARLDKLEQDNRRLKLALGALLLALAAVPLIGAVMPEQVQDTVRARGFYVVDENGTSRAGMNKEGIIHARAFWVIDENDNLRAGMLEDGIAYLDENGTTRAAMNDSGIVYRDENGNRVWSTDCAPNC